MATKRLAITDEEFLGAVREVVSEYARGKQVDFFKVSDTLISRGVHCEKDELLTVLASLSPMVLAAEISAYDESVLVQFTKV